MCLATYVYAHLYYWEEDDSVSGGHSPYAYCWNSWFPGWTIEDSGREGSTTVNKSDGV